MKQIQVAVGGRPFNWDDVLTIQQELTDAVQAQFLGVGPFVLAGCAVSGPATGATITAGILCLDGQLVRFAGASGVALPAQFQAGAVVESDPRPYQTGGTKNTMREVPAVVVASNPTYLGGEFLAVDIWGAKTWQQVQASQQRTMSEVQWVAALATADYDATGLGKPGSAAWGWGLCDGQGGRVDLRGAFVAGYDPAKPEYAIGATGGAATITLGVQHLPSHTHKLGLRFGQSNAGQGGPVRTDGRNDGELGSTSEATGGGQPFNNLPPYLALGARQWVGY